MKKRVRIDIKKQRYLMALKELTGIKIKDLMDLINEHLADKLNYWTFRGWIYGNYNCPDARFNEVRSAIESMLDKYKFIGVKDMITSTTRINENEKEDE